MNGDSNIEYNTAASGTHTFAEGGATFVRLYCYDNKYNIQFKETTANPSNYAGFGQFYTKSDNILYFIDGDGTTHTIAYV